ncbi:endonuclease 4 [uncultured archaeon]|nr:endonuclease 4 [uncultured archaeon]
MIKIGPAGMGPVKDAEKTFEEYHKIGFHVCEIPFTYGVFIKDQKTAESVGKLAKKFDIELTIHAPYWINLNSTEKEKIEASKKRILDCCEVGTWLGASRVIFHCGFYGKTTREQTFENIKQRVIELKEECKKKQYTPALTPEIMGKINVFGSIEEIHALSEQTGCSFCIDFAHILARYKDYKFEEVKKLFQDKRWHVHFSGIEYGDKGEKHHKLTPEKEIRILLDNLPKNKSITLINESPNPPQDSLKTLNLFNRR